MNRQIAICNNAVQQYIYGDYSLQHFNLHGIRVPCGVVHTKTKDFDPKSEQHANFVLLKKRAFSCNYRDKGLALGRLDIMTEAGMKTNPKFYALGSEFSAEVVSVGKNVKNLVPGDRVISNGNYPAEHPDARPGLPTNHGSKEFEILHFSKVVKIPDNMSWEVAAGFPIGGQTTYSMIRKLNIQPGDKVLVTSATSNTSLFAINALKKYNVEVYALSTRETFRSQLLQMGVRDVFVIDPAIRLTEQPDIVQHVRSTRKLFNVVIDPFFDIYFRPVLDLLEMGGRYTTCGMYHQHQKMNGEGNHQLTEALFQVLLKNITIYGNCLGSTQDLQKALDDYRKGDLEVIMDQVFSGNEVEAFFDRTFNSKERFGKVVYVY